MNEGKCVSEMRSAVVSNRNWLLWAAIVLTCVTPQIFTIAISPTIFQDEVEITEWGRTTLFEPHSTWSATWLPSAQAPLHRITYLGPALQEIAYRLTKSYVGPRVLSLAGAAVCASLMMLLLVRVTRNVGISMALGAAFLIDPVVVSSYRNGRVDVWALAAVIAASLLLTNRDGAQRPLSCAAAAGALFTAAVWLYTTAGLLLPLLLLCLITGLSEHPAEQLWTLETAKQIAACFAGMAGAAMALLIPVWRQIPEYVGEVLYVVKQQDQAAHSLSYRLFSFWLSPVITLVLIWALLKRSGPKYIPLVLGICAAAICMTHAYAYRFLYLYPIFFIVIGVALGKSPGRFMKGVLVAVLAWAVGISLCYRSYVALATRDGRNPKIVWGAASDLLGEGRYAVMPPLDFYYAGRELGWQMRMPWNLSDPRRPEDRALAQANLQEVNYVISEGVPDDNLQHLLSSSGFRCIKTYREQRPAVKWPIPLPMGATPYAQEYLLFARADAK